MNLKETLDRLAEADIFIELVEGQLKVKAPKGKLDTQKLDFLKKHKQELIEYLSIGKEISDFDDIYAIEEQDHYPVSSAQKRLWILDQFEESKTAYHVIHAVRVTGVNQELFQQAIQRVIDRYEILRGYFVMADGITRQRFHRKGSGLAFSHIELNDPEELDKIVRDQVSIESTLPFNLSSGPMMRVKLIELSNNDFVALITLHHIITDGWSLGILFEEIFGNCRKLRSKKIVSDTLQIQYKDYAVWQQELLKGPQREYLSQYWKSRLSGELNTIDLSTKPGRPALKTWNSSAAVIEISKETSDELKLLTTKYGSSLFMILLATVKAFVYRYSRKEDIIIGSPVSGRVVNNLNDQQGFFVNMLPIRSRLDEKTSFDTLIGSVRERLIEAMDYQIFPFEEMVAASGIERDASRNPIFDIVVQIQEKGDFSGDQGIDGVRVESWPTGLVSNPYDLTFLFETDLDDHITLNLEYNTDIFSDKQINSLKRYYSYFVDNLVKQIDHPIYQCELIPEVEKSRYIHEFNRTDASFSDGCLHTLFEETARKVPQNIAVKDNLGSLTYHELNSRANQISRFINENIGEKPGGLIGLLVEQNNYVPLGIMGILKAGFAYVPIDPSYPIDRQQYILDHSTVQAVITDNQYPVSEKYDHLKFLNIRDASLDHLEATDPELAQSPQDLVYTIYTSGSTGRPKGVAVEHKAVVNTIEWVNREFNVGVDDRIICLTSICFDLSVYDIFGGLLAGATLYMTSKEQIIDPNSLKELLSQEKITFWNSVPTTMGFLVEELEKEDEDFLLKSLKTVFLSGDWLPVSLPEKINKYFPEATVVNLGGATETTVWANSYTIQNVEKGQKSIPYGKPISNLTLHVLDDYLTPVPEGRIGEMYYGGTGVVRGYLNSPTLTDQSFIPDPFHSHNGTRLYKTGDLGRRMEDGNVEFIGRKDFQVKIRGYRVELGEIETVMLKHPYVREAVVVNKREEQQNQLIGYYTLESNTENSDLRQFLKEALPDYMVPQYLVKLDQFPQNENGKIHRKELMQRPLPEQSGEEKSGYLDTKYDIEEQILSIWEEVLGIEVEGIHSNFFELGGHSLQITRIITLLHQKVGVNFPVRAFFQNPTIYNMALLIRKEEYLKYDDIKVVPKKSRYEASHAQKRLWLGSKYSDQFIAFNVPGVFEINGSLDIDVLEKVVKALIERHEILRTSFVMEDDELYQVVKDHSENLLSVQIEDASKWDNRDEAVRAQIDQHLKTVFDLKEAPLVKVILFKMDEDRHILSIVIHHIVTDGWSTQVLMDEFWKLYNAFSQHTENPLDSLEIQYKDYAEWHNNWLHSDQKEDSQRYWQDEFRDGAPVLQFPISNARPKVRSYQGNGDKIYLDHALFGELQRISRKQGITLYSTLLSLFNTLFYAYTHQKNIIVGVLAAGRDHPDLEDQVGYYINNLPIQTTLDGDMTFGDAMDLVSDKVMKAYQNQLYPFDLIVRDSGITPDTGRSSLFDVMIQLLHFDYQSQLEKENLDLTVADYDIFFAQTRYDLEISLQPENDGLVCEIKYNDVLFEAGSIRLLLERFKYLSERIASNTDVTINSIADEVMNYFPSSLASKYEINHLFWFERLRTVSDQNIKANISSRSEYISFDCSNANSTTSEVFDHDPGGKQWLHALMAYAFLLHKYGTKQVLLTVMGDGSALNPHYYLYNETAFSELDLLYAQTMECVQSSGDYGTFSREKLGEYIKLNTSFNLDQIGRFGMIKKDPMDDMHQLSRKYDLLLVLEGASRKQYTLYYNPEMYDELTMNRFVQHYQQTLEFINSGVEQMQNELEIQPV